MELCESFGRVSPSDRTGSWGTSGPTMVVHYGLGRIGSQRKQLPWQRIRTRPRYCPVCRQPTAASGRISSRQASLEKNPKRGVPKQEWREKGRRMAPIGRNAPTRRRTAQGRTEPALIEAPDLHSCSCFLGTPPSGCERSLAILRKTKAEGSRVS